MQSTAAAEMLRLAQPREPVFVRRHALQFFPRFVFDDDRDLIGGVALTAVNTPTVVVDQPVNAVRSTPRWRGRGRWRAA